MTVQPAPALLNLLAGGGAAGVGRWLGFSWPVSVLVGISVWLVVTGLVARRA